MDDERLLRLKDKYVLIASPVQDRPSRDFCLSLVTTTNGFLLAGIKYEVTFLNGASDVAAGRNRIVATFLSDEKYTDLLWIDSDIAWKGKDALRLLTSEKDVICGTYLKKIPQKVYTIKPTIPMVKCDQEDLIAVDGMGFGFVKTSRRAIKKLVEAYPELKIDVPEREAEENANLTRDNYYAFFQCTGYKGEDFFFCDLWRKLGETVWLDPTIQLVHSGQFNYVSDDMKDLMEAIESEHRRATEEKISSEVLEDNIQKENSI